MSALSPEEFLEWEKKTPATIDVKLHYIDVAGDFKAGVLLSQIIYWHLPSKKTGQTKLRISRGGRLWIAKTRRAWYMETRLREKAFDRALRILEKKGLIIYEVRHFRNLPTVHISLNLQKFLEALGAIVNQPELPF